MIAGKELFFLFQKQSLREFKCDDNVELLMHSPWNNHCKIYWQCCLHEISVRECSSLVYPNSPTSFSCQSLTFDTLGTHNVQTPAAKRKRVNFLFYSRNVNLIFESYQLIEAGFVQQMTTVGYMTRISGCMDIAQTYRTIRSRYVFHALKWRMNSIGMLRNENQIPENKNWSMELSMEPAESGHRLLDPSSMGASRFPAFQVCLVRTHFVPVGFQLQWQTHVAHFTMEKVISPADATNSTSITVILIFIFIVEEIAN